MIFFNTELLIVIVFFNMWYDFQVRIWHTLHGTRRSCNPCSIHQISSLQPRFHAWQQHPGLFQTDQCKPPCFQTYTVMNILIRSGAVAGQDLAQRTPKGPRRSQSRLRTRVTGDYHAGHIFITIRWGETARHRPQVALLIPYSFLLFTTSSLLHLKEEHFTI